MKKNRKLILSTIILVLGLLLFLYPDFQMWRQKQQADEALARVSFAEKDPCVKDLLRKELEDYNTNLLENGQNLIDCWSYEQNPIPLMYMPENSDAIGKIRIPDMEVEMPLLLGASVNNMAQGAVVLSETSMPIGGVGTNCVIAGHRGYRGGLYFRNIQDLQIGSSVYIDNPWETLEYVVIGTNVILPDDLSCLDIQKDKDMVTLITCHPYMGDRKYRYVVYCERVGSGNETVDDIPDESFTESVGNGMDEDEITSQNKHSEFMVLLETRLRYILTAVFVIWWLILLLRRIKRKL